MSTPQDAQQRAIAAYDAASDFYDHPTNSFWERYGERTVERLQLARGADVLDVCCGSGASALPAAEAVGPAGSVLGVDLAEKLLVLARRKAAERGLANVEFRAGDMLALDLPDARFDAVVCVFGIFFVPDMGAAVRELWRLVRPGGRLALTTWGPRFFEPLNTVLWDAVRALRPDLDRRFRPWERVTTPEALAALFREAGVAAPEAVAESGAQPVPAPEAWWAMVLGSGYRGTIEQLDPVQREHVRAECLAFIRANDVRSIEANVVYGVARRPLSS